MKKSILSCAALCLLLIPSCKKKEDEPARKEILTSGKWIQTASKSYITTGGVTNTIDNYAGAAACDKDDLSIFKTDNHLITDQGASKCDPTSAQQTDEGIWSLTENDTKLLVVGGGFGLSFKINTLNSSNLELEYSDTASSIVSRQVVTFSHVD